MSTAGSGPKDTAAPSAPSAYTPPEQGTHAPKKAKKPGLFRWKAILPLGFFLLLLIGGWFLFGELLIKRGLVKALTAATGAEVDIASVHVGFITPSFEIRGLQIASTSDSSRNLVQFSRFRVIVEGLPLLQKKVVVRDISIDSMRAMAKRKTAARKIPPSPPNPMVASALKSAGDFAGKFKVQALSLVPIDSIKALVLKPEQLQTVVAARALGAKADSFKTGVVTKFNNLKLSQTADSAQALVTRLQGANPKTLGLQGTKNAVDDVKRFLNRVDSTRKALDAMQATVRAGADSLVNATRSLDSTRQADFDMAKSLLKLPTFDAPNIGPALFGQEAIKSFQKGVYYVNLAREYTPPGLLPHPTPGPKRLRRAGTNVHFAKQQGIPRFLLQHAAFDLTIDSAAGSLHGAYGLHIQDFTTEPALTGKPAAFSISRASKGTVLDSLLIVGVLDHTKARPVETLVVQAAGVAFPGFNVPGVPLRLDLGTGVGGMRMELSGDSVRGHLTASSPHPKWRPDSTHKAPLNMLEDLVVRVLSGIPNVDMSGDISGTVTAPRLAVRSNLDAAVADNIKRVAGEEISKAEAKVKAQVDTLVDKETAPVKAKIADMKSQVDKQVADANARLDKAKSDLNAKLKDLSGGLVPDVPGIKIPGVPTKIPGVP